MPSYDSPIGKKNIAGSPMREFTVPDDEMIDQSVNPVFNAQRARAQQMPNIDEQALRKFQASVPSEEDIARSERDIREARVAKQKGIERLSDGAKRRIDMLLGMTRHTRTCTIGDTDFVFQTLKGKEMREAITMASNFDGTVQSPFEIRTQFLARSLVQIGGIDIDQFIGSSNLDDKLLFIEELDEALSNRLYDEYVILANEAKDKYSIKTDSDIKEVAAELKK